MTAARSRSQAASWNSEDMFQEVKLLGHAVKI